MVVSCQPFTAVDCPEWRDLMTYVRPFLKDTVHADAMRRRILAQSEKGREKLKEILKVSRSCRYQELCTYSSARSQNVPMGKLPLAVDAWTSTTRLAFLALVGLWIDEDWNMHEVLLDFIELEGAHSGENMAEYVLGTLKDLDMLESVSNIVRKFHNPANSLRPRCSSLR